MMLSFFGDALVCLLLVVTISYAAILNRRLSVLRGDRSKLEALVAGLTVAAQRAEAGIAGLKDASEDSGRRLEKEIELARKLRDDLHYMFERGSQIADRLEGTIRARRDEVRIESSDKKREPKLETPKLETAPRAPEGESARTLAASRAERELLRALASR